jgi:transcriptional regulator with XRE-family HTH domain
VDKKKEKRPVGRPRGGKAAPTDSFGGELGSRIRARRVKLGRSIEECAREAGLSTSGWSYNETGWTIPTIDRFLKICRVLKVRARDLLPKDSVSDLNGGRV